MSPMDVYNYQMDTLTEKTEKEKKKDYKKACKMCIKSYKAKGPNLTHFDVK